MAKIVRLPVPLDAEENVRANAERTRRLFEWAATVLKDLGLAKAVAQATSLEELRGITLNVDADVSLAIRDAYHNDAGLGGKSVAKAVTFYGSIATAC